MKEQIEQMLTSIALGKRNDANEQFQSIITQKVADRLEDIKIDVADKHFNTVEGK